MPVRQVEFCAVSDVFSKHEGAGTLEYLTEYLKPFAKPKIREGATAGSGFGFGNTLCLKCDEPQDGLFGNFRWGLAHGEGFCGKCKWPARLYHYLKLPDGTEGRVTAMLQYHPDFVLSHSPDWSADALL